MATYDELRATAEPKWAAAERPARPLFVVSINTSSIAAGARETLEALQKLSVTGGFDAGVTGDTGLAWAEPVVQVRRPDGPTVLYGRVTADDAQAFAAAAAQGIAKEFAIGIVDGPAQDGVPALADLDWFKAQVRWMMHNCGVIDPDDIDHYIGRGGYGTFMRWSTETRDEVIKVVTGSTLRGHSGSFFSTGTKWKFLKDAAAEPKYLVCNADEGDPGAWVNRVLMESDPHLILEGMLIAAYASGATYGWIYLRDEYPLAHERLTRAIEACRARGILGPNALGTGVNFDCEVVRGAGAYVCGDETGLISSINDERGMPRIKPPFPAQRGVLGQPTNVNNVETYAAAATLLRIGADEFSTVGTEANRGTKMFTVSGACEKTGCLEVPFGITVQELLAAAGGIAGGRAFKALQQGGPLSGLLPADKAAPLALEPEPFGITVVEVHAAPVGFAGGRAFKALQQGGPLSGLLPADKAAPLALEPEPFRAAGVGMGGGGLIFLDDSACVVDLNVGFAWFLEDESCGRCTTCRGGNQRMLEIVKRVARGQGHESDVERLKTLDATMQYSNCFHGTLSPTMTRNMLQHFREEYDAHSFGHRCPAKVCPELIRYTVTLQSAAVAEAAALCPVRAIAQQGGAWSIDDAACIRCNACREHAPAAIDVVDRYPDAIPLEVVMRATVTPEQVATQARP